VSAALLRTETVRALRRPGNDALIGKARRLFGGLVRIRIDKPLLDRAGDLGPAELRSLDAVRLPAALSIGPDLGVLLTCDICLRDAAAAQGLDVESPADRPCRRAFPVNGMGAESWPRSG